MIGFLTGLYFKFIAYKNIILVLLLLIVVSVVSGNCQRKLNKGDHAIQENKQLKKDIDTTVKVSKEVIKGQERQKQIEIANKKLELELEDQDEEADIPLSDSMQRFVDRLLGYPDETNE